MSERPDDDILSLTERRGISAQGMDRLQVYITALESRLAAYDAAAKDATVEGIMSLVATLTSAVADDAYEGGGFDNGTEVKQDAVRTTVTALVADRDAQAERVKRAEAVVEAVRDLLASSYSHTKTSLKAALDAYDKRGTDGQ